MSKLLQRLEIKYSQEITNKLDTDPSHRNLIISMSKGRKPNGI